MKTNFFNNRNSNSTNPVFWMSFQKIIFVGFCLFTLGTQAQTTYYVAASQSTSGTSGLTWGEAKNTLQDAINEAASGDIIWVKAGTYYPTQDPFANKNPTNPRDKTFLLKNGVKIYGGFAGTETAFSQRNIIANPTILSGDIGVVGDATDNSYHVVLSVFATNSPATTLDGFTIANGNANGTNSITVKSLVVNQNDGGGIYTWFGSNEINNTIIKLNTATNNGGGIYSNYGINMFTNNYLANNTAGTSGGGYFSKNSSSTFANSVFVVNTAAIGGGISTNSNTNSSFINNTVFSNTSAIVGGLYTNNCTNLDLKNNIFWGNKKGNDATIQGADYLEGGSSSNTFYNNLLQLTESNYTTLGSGAVGNIFATNPLFVNSSDPYGSDATLGTADDGLHLQSSSPAISAGNTAVSTPFTDITGVFRGAGAFGLGAYEWASCIGFDTLFVDANVTTSGLGNSWATAYKTLDEALLATQTCPNITTINVAAGTYIPNKKPYNNGIEMATADPRDVTFQLRENIALFGGFPNGGGVRNPKVNITRLSGDIGIADDTTDNAYHVVLAVFTSITPTTTIDGFAIAGGNANTSTSITVNTFTIYRGNGGGIYTKNGNNTFANNYIVNNTASIVGGGAFNIGGTATLGSKNTYTNTTFSDNRSLAAGGAVSSSLCTNTYTNNTFTANNANTNGGAIYANGGATTATSNTFENNNSELNGGAIFSTNGSNTRFTNNTFNYNATGLNGGAISISGNSAAISNNVFANNTGGFGGAIYCTSIVSSIINNTIYNNTATTTAGGLYTNSSQDLQVKNNIFWANKLALDATVPGADYYEGATNGNTFNNNLLQLDASNYTTTGSGSYDLGTAASGNLFGVNPLFLDPTNLGGADNMYRTVDDGLQLQTASPAINAGSMTVTSPSTEIAGITRGVAPFDLGAYEWFSCSGNSTLYVDGTIPSSGRGATWATAYKTLDEAIFEAQNCPNITAINVASGTYKPTKKPYSNGIEITTTDVRDVTFYLRDNLTLYGGFPNGGGLRNPQTNTTILSGDIGVTGNAADNCYHVVLSAFATITPTTGVDGFTITAGNANDTSSSIIVNTVAVNRGNGGGIFTRNGNNTFANNTITNNNAIGNGGAVFTMGNVGILIDTKNTFANTVFRNNTASYGGAVASLLCKNTFTANTFTANTSTNNGGAINVNGGAITANNNTLENNTANNGGAVYTSSGGNSFINTVFNGNTASNSGGGIYVSGVTLAFANNVFTNNNASLGGGIYATGTITITNNTLVNNTATDNGGGIVTNGSTNTKIKSNIFWSNKKGTDATVQGADYFEAATGGTVTSNTFTNNVLQLEASSYTTSGSGPYDIGNNNADNVFASDPLFANINDVDGADNIYRTADDGLALQTASPAINAGDTAVTTPITDITNTNRIDTFDMGAYENTCDTAPPTGDANQKLTKGKTLADVIISGTDIKWYNAKSGKTELPLTTELKDGIAYYATQTLNGCQSNNRLKVITEVVPVIILATNDFDAENFIYYPNPTSGVLHMKNSKTIEKVMIINLLGQNIVTKKSNSSEVTIDLSSLSNGIYLGEIVMEGKTKMIKVVKQ